MAKIDTQFMTKTAENHILWGRTYLYSPYKGVPFPRDQSIWSAIVVDIESMINCCEALLSVIYLYSWSTFSQAPDLL